MSALALASAAPVSEGLLRSARLMRALGPDAHAIWAELSPEDARRLTAAMEQLGPLGDEGEEEAAEAFLRDLSKRPERKSGARSVWQLLSSAPPEIVAERLEGEHPQVLAVIFSHMNSGPASKLLSIFPPALAIDVMQRVLKLGIVHPAALDMLEMSLAEKLAGLDSDDRRGGHERVARIFDRLDSRLEQVFLAALESAEPGAGEKVRALMFTFDDLAKLDAAGMQTLLAAAERSILIVALKGASPATSRAFFSNMTKRAGDMLREEIAAHGAVRRSEVEEARGELIALARSLIHRGDIRTHVEAADEELVG